MEYRVTEDNQIINSDIKVFPREKSDTLVKAFSDLGIDGRIDLLLMHYANEYKYKPKTTDEQKEILSYIFSNFYPRLEKGGEDGREVDLGRDTLSIMEAENLIYSFKDLGCINYKPTAKGSRINERGGWLKHIEKENKKEQQRESDKQLTREVGKSSKRTNRVQIIAAIMTIGIIGFGAYVSYQNLNISRANILLQKQQQKELQSQKEQQSQVLYYQRRADSLYIQLELLKTSLSSAKRNIK